VFVFPVLVLLWHQIFVDIVVTNVIVVVVIVVDVMVWRAFPPVWHGCCWAMAWGCLLLPLHDIAAIVVFFGVVVTSHLFVAHVIVVVVVVAMVWHVFSPWDGMVVVGPWHGGACCWLVVVVVVAAFWCCHSIGETDQKGAQKLNTSF